MRSGSKCVVIVSPALAEGDEVMLALHARRSAESVAAWHAQRGARGLGMVLTGTDLYRDIAHDTQAQQSLALASGLVVLNPLGLRHVPAKHHHKARVILQSTAQRKTLPKTERHLRVVMVGHLRDEKDPLTLMVAAQRLSPNMWACWAKITKACLSPATPTAWCSVYWLVATPTAVRRCWHT